MAAVPVTILINGRTTMKEKLSTLSTAIEKAKLLLSITRHAAMATVNEDGSPHNTPFFFLYDARFKYIYWGSHPDSVHSKNIERTGQIFVVVYNASQPKAGGIYIKAEHAHALAGAELEESLKVHNDFRAKENKDALKLEYYTGDSPQRMYSATPVQCWILMQENGPNGLRIRDYRQEIDIRELLS